MTSVEEKHNSKLVKQKPDEIDSILHRWYVYIYHVTACCMQEPIKEWSNGTMECHKQMMQPKSSTDLIQDPCDK
jgi:hypothetical protein